MISFGARLLAWWQTRTFESGLNSVADADEFVASLAKVKASQEPAAEVRRPRLQLDPRTPDFDAVMRDTVGRLTWPEVLAVFGDVVAGWVCGPCALPAGHGACSGCSCRCGDGGVVDAT